MYANVLVLTETLNRTQGQKIQTDFNLYDLYISYPVHLEKILARVYEELRIHVYLYLC